MFTRTVHQKLHAKKLMKRQFHWKVALGTPKGCKRGACEKLSPPPPAVRKILAHEGILLICTFEASMKPEGFYFNKSGGWVSIKPSMQTNYKIPTAGCSSIQSRILWLSNSFFPMRIIKPFHPFLCVALASEWCGLRWLRVFFWLLSSASKTNYISDPKKPWLPGKLITSVIFRLLLHECPPPQKNVINKNRGHFILPTNTNHPTMHY